MPLLVRVMYNLESYTVNSYEMNTNTEKKLQALFLRVSERLKKARLQHDLSQTQAAELLDISQSQYSKKERLDGTQRFTLEEIMAICDAMGLDFLEVISGNMGTKNSIEATGSSESVYPD